MKSVIFEKKEGVFIDDITNDSYVGIDFNPKKVWLMMDNNEKYIGIRVGDNNTKHKWDAKSKREYCIDAKNLGGVTYVFDTQEELAKWLVS